MGAGKWDLEAEVNLMVEYPKLFHSLNLSGLEDEDILYISNSPDIRNPGSYLVFTQDKTFILNFVSEHPEEDLVMLQHDQIAIRNIFTLLQETNDDEHHTTGLRESNVSTDTNPLYYSLAYQRVSKRDQIETYLHPLESTVFGMENIQKFQRDNEAINYKEYIQTRELFERFPDSFNLIEHKKVNGSDKEVGLLLSKDESENGQIIVCTKYGIVLCKPNDIKELRARLQNDPQFALSFEAQIALFIVKSKVIDNYRPGVKTLNICERGIKIDDGELSIDLTEVELDEATHQEFLHRILDHSNGF